MAYEGSAGVRDHEVEAVLPPPVQHTWFRIASFPHRTIGNPGLEMFYAGLAHHGVALTGRLTPSAAWVTEHASELDAIHVHWPEKIWRGRPGGRLEKWSRVVTFADWRAQFEFEAALVAAKRAGLRRIWTVHNVEPHDGATRLDRRGYRIAARESDLIICYSTAAAERIRDVYKPPCEVAVVPHGNYFGCYPPPGPRKRFMESVGLDPSRPLVACIGIVRAYKGLDVATEAVRQLGGDVQLAICGVPRSKADAALLRKAMVHVAGVFLERSLPDQGFADLIAASEAVLLPYRNITGSGSLLAAWSSGRGVVASDLPLFREMLAPEPRAGALFPAGDSRGLADAIRSYLAVPREERTDAALRLARYYDWKRTVQPVVQVFRQWKKQ
jgi:glycosyltransferase involved in cell wall biosynthesis